MRREFTFVLVILVASFGVHLSSVADNWPAWRGPTSNGVVPAGDPPIKWSERKNVKWKVALPGSGSSTPVIWGDKILLTTAVALGEEPKAAGGRPKPGQAAKKPTVPYRFNLVCLERETGKLIWEKTVREAVPHEGHHPTGSYASYSPVTDGQYVWASFGSRGLHCYDLDGNHQWSNDLIQLTTSSTFGEGSSAVLAGNAVVVLMDHEGDSKIFAFNKVTGETLWVKDRDERTSWATPLVLDVDGVLQIITSGATWLTGYDAATGEVLWRTEGWNDEAIPSPVAGHGAIYFATGYKHPRLRAIRLGQTGEISESDSLIWEIDKNTPYVSSPLVSGERIYVTRGMTGYISCFNARTGEELFVRQKFEGMKQIYASPIAVAGRVYIADRKGMVAIIKDSDTFELIATNTLNDGFDASPVVVGDELFLKGVTHLYCIAKKK